MTQLIEIKRDSNHWMGTWGPLVVVFWTGQLEPELLRRFRETGRKMADQQLGKQISVLSIVTPLQARPSPEAREALATLVREGEAWMSRLAVLREDRGFIASFVSSVILGIQMMVRPSHGYRPFTELPAAVRWVTEELKEFRTGALRPESIESAIEAQQRQLFAESATSIAS